MNRKSGWKALTGTTDFGLITERADLSSSSDNPSPNTLAFNLLTDRILDYIGSYYLKLGGEVDALVFAGGIGEKSKQLREVIGAKVKCLGFAPVDGERNGNLGEGVVFDIGKAEGEAVDKRLLVCRTDEQVCRLFIDVLVVADIKHVD